MENKDLEIFTKQPEIDISALINESKETQEKLNSLNETISNE